MFSQAGALSGGRAEAALADLLALGVEDVHVEPLLVREWQLRDNFTIHDGVFVALAEVTAQPLLTIVVADYDAAISFFVDALGFDPLEDSPSLTNAARFGGRPAPEGPARGPG